MASQRRAMAQLRHRLRTKIQQRPGERELVNDEERQTFANELKRYAADLKSRFARFKEYFDALLNAEVADNERQAFDAQIDADVDTMGQCDVLLDEITGRIDELTATTSLGPVAGQRPHRSATKLQKLDVVKFNGDRLQWFAFWDSFRNAIDNNDALTTIEKMSYLKAQLVGDAYTVIFGMAVTEDNYRAAVDILQSRYGNRTLIIDSHYAALASLPPASNQTSQLRKLLDQIEQHLYSLQALGEPVDGRQLATTIRSKLPDDVKIDLERQARGNDLTVQQIRDELRLLITAKERAVDTTPKPVTLPTNGHNKPSRTTTGTLQVNDRSSRSGHPTCVFCNDAHWSDQCQRFTTVAERKQRLKNRCHNCLAAGHQLNDCRRTKPCFYCKLSKAHHSSLCPSRTTATNTNRSVNLATESNETVETTMATTTSTMDKSTNPHVHLQTAIVEVQSPTGHQSATIRMLLDCGSQRSYVSQRLATVLKLESKSTDALSIFTFCTKKPKEITTPTVDLKLMLKSNASITISANVVPIITAGVQRAPSNGQRLSLFDIVTLADEPPSQLENAPVDLLLGNDLYFDIVTAERIKLDKGLYLIGSKVGWLVSGRQQSHQVTNATSTILVSTSLFSNSLCHVPSDDTLTDRMDLQKFWDLESIGIKDRLDNPDDEAALKRFNDDLVLDKGRYHIKWPWKGNFGKLPTNFPLALGRLKSLWKRHTDKQFFDQYQTIINDQLANGVIEMVDANPMLELSSSNDGGVAVRHYLPHHAMVKPGKETTQLRIVFDGSAKARKTDPSLNDCLLRGPVVLTDVAKLLIRFRLDKFAVIADIEKAFLQIGLQESERDATRFLWLKDTSKPPTMDNLLIFRFCRVPFGVISSPFLVAAAITYHLLRSGTQTALQILSDIYVDNIVTSVDSCDDAMRLYEQSKTLFSEMSMNIREWASNCSEFIDQLPQTDRASGQQQRVLGIIWNVQSDDLQLSAPTSSPETQTKRTILQFVASIFDPLGMAAPIILIAKIFLQTLWKDNVGWDDELSENRQLERTTIVDQILPIAHLRIDRRILSSGRQRLEIHCFCDASQLAYGACVYLRSVGNDKIDRRLVFAKSRVAPITPITLPRLELMGALLGSKVTVFVLNSIRISVDQIYLWSDSQCVLHWLNSRKPLPVFIANRVRQIKDAGNFNFRFVPGSDNPADLASRGTSAIELERNEPWWFGPKWLADDEQTWPANIKTTDAIDTNIDQQRTTTLAGLDADTTPTPATPYGLNCSDFSNLERLLRLTAWLQRFRKRLKGIRPESDELTIAELNDARTIWVKYVQTACFTDVLIALQKGKRHPLIDRLELFTNRDNLLCCGGRFAEAALSPTAKHPVLLPRRHEFTTLVIRATHERLFHAGTAHTLAQLREQFWVPSGRASVFNVIRQCGRCRRYDGGPYRAPPMPDLPAIRVTATPAFTTTGIDYIGPLFIRSEAETTAKVWILLCTCLATRAVHLELVGDLSGAEFLLALKRFISRRGKPTTIISDNAKQFKLVQRTLRRYASEQWVNWHFIPERAPWMGGFTSDWCDWSNKLYANRLATSH